MERLGEVPVAVIEKGKVCGAHNLSGAMMRPSGLQELFPDLEPKDWPTYGQVDKDSVYWMLSPNRALPLKPTPPPFRNHGNYVVSVAELSRWLADKAEEAGAYILTETAAAQLLVEDGAVRGIRSGDKGRGKDGRAAGQLRARRRRRRPGHRAGRGHLGPPDRRGDPRVRPGRRPRAAGVGARGQGGLEGPASKLDRVIHTLGWPLRYGAKHKEFGGSWIYPMGDDRVSIGFVVGLDYTDATVSGHDLLQQFKTSKLVRRILEGGERVAWGAKAIPEGGYWAMPKLSAPGMVIAGDAGGMVNVPVLKGIHYAIHAGILAAEEIFAKLKAGSNDF